MSAPRRWILFAGGLSLTACAGLAGLFVSQRDRIVIPHQRHARAGVDCGSCHETIFESTNLETRDLPLEKKCFECHKDEQRQGSCSYCHTAPERPLTYPVRARHLKMSHAGHLERVKDDCQVCHRAGPEPFVVEGLAPPMDTCLGCHEHAEQFKAGNCEVCHLDLTRYPLEPLSAFSHRGDFLRTHRLEARAAGAGCASCHEQTFCSDCHAKTVAVKVEVLLPERVDRSFIHRLDFFSRHSVEARADETTCQRCHGINFCQGCHQKNRLDPGSGTTLDPHPAGFGDGELHGPAARRDIVSCAACHDQGAASSCVGCHRVGGIGGDPHPPGWTVRHGNGEVDNAMCQTCHL